MNLSNLHSNLKSIINFLTLANAVGHDCFKFKFGDIPQQEIMNIQASKAKRAKTPLL